MRTIEQILDHDFLEARCQLLEIAAMLDRCERASEADDVDDAGRGGEDARPDRHSDQDQRFGFLYQALELLANRNAGPNRSEQLLHIYTQSC